MSYINSFLSFLDKGDHAFVQSLFYSRDAWLTKIFLSFTDLAGAYVVVALSIFLLFAMFYWKNRRDLILPFIVTMAGAIGTSEVLKHFIHRARPDVFLQAVTETGFSLPSIHSTAAVALYGFFIYFSFKESEDVPYQTLVLVLGVLLILLIGFSRIYIGVHYPTDVLTGFIIGLVWLMVGVRIKYKIFK